MKATLSDSDIHRIKVGVEKKDPQIDVEGLLKHATATNYLALAQLMLGSIEEIAVTLERTGFSEDRNQAHELRAGMFNIQRLVASNLANSGSVLIKQLIALFTKAGNTESVGDELVAKTA
jgi:hypothetical protein